MFLGENFLRLLISWDQTIWAVLELALGRKRAWASPSSTSLRFRVRMAPGELQGCHPWTKPSSHFRVWSLLVLRNIPRMWPALNGPQLPTHRQRISVPWQQHMQTPWQMSPRRSPGNSPQTGKMLQRQMCLDSPWDCKWIWNWKEKRVKVS